LNKIWLAGALLTGTVIARYAPTGKLAVIMHILSCVGFLCGYIIGVRAAQESAGRAGR
jgi:basic membrane lipoprotein Med (substrate-binding protein (PBP1-ABC) superfamily)